MTLLGHWFLLPLVNREVQIELLERDPRFTGKRVADVPAMAWFRLKWRWRFYRIADAGFVLLIWNAYAAMEGSNFALAMAGFNSWLIWFAESRARLISRQLHRSAAEQIWLDLNGLHNF